MGGFETYFLGTGAKGLSSRTNRAITSEAKRDNNDSLSFAYSGSALSGGDLFSQFPFTNNPSAPAAGD
jgi:hypothetical protein